MSRNKLTYLVPCLLALACSRPHHHHGDDPVNAPIAPQEGAAAKPTTPAAADDPVQADHAALIANYKERSEGCAASGQVLSLVENACVAPGSHEENFKGILYTAPELLNFADKIDFAENAGGDRLYMTTYLYKELKGAAAPFDYLQLEWMKGESQSAVLAEFDGWKKTLAPASSKLQYLNAVAFTSNSGAGKIRVFIFEKDPKQEAYAVAKIYSDPDTPAAQELDDLINSVHYAP